MTPFNPPPDWQGQYATGMWQIGYRIRDDFDLIFFRGGGANVPANPQREWGVALLRASVRDREEEAKLRTNQALAQRITTWTSTGGEMLKVPEAEINEVVRLAIEIYSSRDRERERSNTT